MERHWSFAQYRAADLCCFAVICGVCEYVITVAAAKWFPGQLYTVSVTAAVCAIVLMRWGAWAGLPALLGGAVFCLASGANGEQYAIYCIGNLACLAALPLLRGGGKTRIRSDKLLAALFALGVTLAMQLGRAIVALALGTALSACVGFFTTDALTDLFTAVVVSLARKLDGIFEDQKSYLLRISEQDSRQEKGGFQ